MIDLCIDARMAYSAGIGTFLRQIVPQLNQPPFRVTLLVSILDQPWCKGIEQIHFPAPIYSMQEQLFFPLKIPRCDLFWSPHYNVPLLPIRAKKRVTTIHDACHLALKQFFSLPVRFYAKALMKRAFFGSNAVVTISNFSKQELLRFLGPPNCPLSVIPLAVDSDFFHRSSDEAAEAVRLFYQLPPSFALFVGSCKRHKNLHALLDAFSRLPLPDLHLVIVGKQQGLRHAVEQICKERVHWLGEVPEKHLPQLYTLASLFVFPSLYEGFGLPPLEAMSCGCPTVVSHAASLPEVCGNSSVYVDPANPTEIASAMVKVASDADARRQIVQRGYERASLFSWRETVRLYRELFQSVFKRD